MAQRRVKTYSGKLCYRCLKSHDPKECPFKNAECFACKLSGHNKAACRLRNASITPKKKYKPFKIKTSQEHSLNYVNDINGDLYFVKSIGINGKKINFEVDSGAAYSIISKKTM